MFPVTRSPLSFDTVTTASSCPPEEFPPCLTPCSCRSKTQLLTNTAYSSSQLYQPVHRPINSQSWPDVAHRLECLLNRESMEKVQIQTSMHSLLSKQLAKFRTRLAAAVKANLSIHAKIINFNTFSLSLFYYAQTHRYFAPPLLKPLYQSMAKFLLRRHWFPQRMLVGLCRWF